jgi:hypothetical protein
MAGYGRSEERESVAGERREMLWVTLRWARYTGAAEACVPLDLWWKDRVAVIGPICRLIGRSGWTKCWSGVTRCTEISVHRVTWRNGIKA